MTSCRLFFSLMLIFVIGITALVGCNGDQQSITAPEHSSGREIAEGQLQPQATAANIQWWRNRTQAERNMLILERAYRDLNQNVGVQCKPWVDDRVVRDASRTVVDIPATLPDAFGWYYGYSPYLHNGGGIRNVQPGWIVQMRYRWSSYTGPHTFIISWKSSTHFGVIESNVKASNTVGERTLSFTEFEQKAERYTCYYVTGG